MSSQHLEKLTTAVQAILKERKNTEAIAQLKQEIKTSKEPFVWSTLEMEKISGLLPQNIKSAWIFVLKKDTPSGSHYHPNSIQHMTMHEGKGHSCIGGIWKEMSTFAYDGDPTTQWEIIEAGTSHEFFPRETDMVVISFHTCTDEELVEVSTDSKHQRVYEPPTK